MSITLSNAPLLYPNNNLSLQCHSFQNPLLFLNKSRKRNTHAFGRSNKLLIDSAFIIASKLGVLPAPLDLILRDHFGSGSGSGSGNGFGFGWNGDGGWRKRRGKMTLLGVWVLVCGVILWVLCGNEMVLSFDVLFGGLVLFGGSFFGKDWIFGFLCCGFLMGLVSKKEEFRIRVLSTLNVRKYGERRRRKMRLF